MTNTISNLESSISSLNDDVSKLTSDLKSSKTETDNKAQEISSLQTQLKTKTDSLVLVLGELEKLKPTPKPVVVSNNKNSNSTNEVIQTGSLKSVKIGTQIWTAENLNVSTFRNGDTIPEARNFEELDKYIKNNQPAWCYYNFDKNNGQKYGKLYNGYAVKDPRGLALEGWHIPADPEMRQLGFELGVMQAGKKLKSQSGWNNWESGGDYIPCNNCENASKEYKKICPSCKGTGYKGKTAIISKNGNGTDIYKFSAKPSGYSLAYSDKFYSIGEYARYWTTSETSNGVGRTIDIGGYDELKYDNASDGDYNAIRLVKDYKIDYNSVVDKRNNKNYKTNKIGSQTWICENLDVATFRNGDPIPEANSKEEWERAGEEKRPMSCYYDFDQSNGEKYGKLYNYYAVHDSRGLAPEGFHIPSENEWNQLIKHLSEDFAGFKMKTSLGWEKRDFAGGSNVSGFSAVPAGWILSDGRFEKMGYMTGWWSSDESYDPTKWGKYLDDLMDCAEFGEESRKSEGNSIRCLRD